MSGPAPRLTFTLNKADYHKACADLDLKSAPKVTFLRTTKTPNSEPCYGLYYPHTNAISIMTAHALYEVDGLRHVASEVVITLLHEVRHAWQDQQFGHDWYGKNTEEAERDAEQYGRAKVIEHRGLVRISRKHHGSGMSRLERTAAIVRNSEERFHG